MAARWLSLAATPTFAAMAVLTSVSGGHGGICSSAMPSFLPGDPMVWMYALMGVFHLPPWLGICQASPAERCSSFPASHLALDSEQDNRYGHAEGRTDSSD